MLINSPTPISYSDIIAFVKTKKQVNEGDLEWHLWIERREAAAIIKRLQTDRIIGPAYIQKIPPIPGHIIDYDVITNNQKPQSSPSWQLWGYKLETAILFTRFLWLTLKNRVAGKKNSLDMVVDATHAVATELKVDYRIGIDQQLNGREYHTIELREPIDDKLSEELLLRLRHDLTLKGFKINRSKNLLEFYPSF